MPRIFAAVSSGIFLVLILSLPHVHLGALAWISLIPLLLSCDGTSIYRAFALGWITGMIAFSGALYWIVIAMHQYGNIPLLMSMLILALFAAYLGLFIGTFSTLIAWFLRHFPHPSFLVWVAPPTWVTLEIVRTHLFTGFPWALLGYSQHQWLSMIQIADITGVYGVSFLVVLVNALFTILIRTSMRWLRQHHSAQVSTVVLPSVATIIIVALTFVYGQIRQDTLQTADTRELRLGLIQPNIDQGRKWDPAFRQETMDRYHRLTEHATNNPAGDEVDLIVWPEAATPFVFASEDVLRDQITALIQRQQTPLLFGSIAVKERTEKEPVQLLNRAYLLSPQGAVLSHYDKMHLVPFGEYVPGFLSFINKLAHGIGDYVPGSEYTILSGPHGRFGVAICFEVVYPDLVRRFVKHGAEYMVTITNDAWYDRSSAPYQHFSMVVFRAIENRMSFARAANTGISGFIDADGSVRSQTNLFEQVAIVDTVTLGHDQTVYTIYGDLFAYTCTAATLALMFFTFGRRRSSEAGSHTHR